MAIIKNGINGPYSGKVGSVIGSKWKKIDYVKGLPRWYRNKGKPSESQLLQRQKFTLLNQFLRHIGAVLEIGFGNYISKSTPRSAAFQYNYDHAFITNEQGEPRLDYKAIQLSRGSLFKAGEERAEFVDGDLRITWHTETYGLNGALDDEVHILLYFEEKGMMHAPEKLPLRYQGAYQFSNLDRHKNDTIHIWLFLSDSQRKRVSPTTYLSIS